MSLSWFLNSGDRYPTALTEENFCYTIIPIGDVYGAFVDMGRDFGYLSGNYIIECGVALVASVGLKPNCRFNSIEEAKKICENHYKHLILI